MKTTFKLLTAVALTSSLVASQAFANDWQAHQRMGDSNMAYFQQKGTQTASNSAPSASVNEDATPQQRNAKRNAEYWAGKTSNTDVQPNQPSQPQRYKR